MLAHVRATIRRFEASLGDDQAIEARCLTMSKEVAFRLRGVQDTGMDTLMFYGVDKAGRSVAIAQHVAMMSVLFAAIKKVAENDFR